MDRAREFDSVCSTADTVSDDDRTIPAGMTGAVIADWPNGTVLVEYAFAEQTADSHGDFVQGFLSAGQYEIVHRWPGEHEHGGGPGGNGEAASGDIPA